MFPDKQQFKESAYIGEELFDDVSYEIERQCQSVQRGIERRLFTLDVGLLAYRVTKEQYEDYLGKNMADFLINAVFVETKTSTQASYLHVLNYMLDRYTTLYKPKPSRHLTSALNAIQKLSQEVEQEASSLDE